MPASPMKFTFDLDLEHRNERSTVLSETAMGNMVARAREEGLKEGMRRGEQSVAAEASRRVATAAEAIAAQVAGAAGEVDAARRQYLAEAVNLAAAIGRKLAAALITREPTVEIDALITECLASLDNVPHLAIRCGPEVADAVRDIANARMAHSGFSGRLVVLGDPEIGFGDARIEWADGGVVRDLREIAAEIDARILEFLTARGVPAAAPPEAEP